MSLFYFLHGKSAHPFDVLSVYLLGLAAGLVVLHSLEPLNASDWVLGFIAADTVGGIVSNATVSTRQQWREQLPRSRHVFLILHALCFPIIIVVLNGLTNILSVTMLTGLFSKILIFKAGQDQKVNGNKG